jgi:hypothetical protein
MTPGDLYRTCRVSAYRLETLQHYVVSDDAERQNAFHAGQPLPAPRPDKVADLRLIRSLREKGRKLGRVHIVDQPLSDYIRYELAVYAENVAAGEDIRIADRSLRPELITLTRDFVIFDGETDRPSVILFNYDTDGVLLGYEHTTDQMTAARCWRQYRRALIASEPLGGFLAASA